MRVMQWPIFWYYDFFRFTDMQFLLSCHSFFFRLSAQWHVLGTNLSVYTSPSLSNSDMYRSLPIVSLLLQSSILRRGLPFCFFPFIFSSKITPSITSSLVHSSLKTHLLHKIIPTIDLSYPPDCLHGLRTAQRYVLVLSLSSFSWRVCRIKLAFS